MFPVRETNVFHMKNIKISPVFFSRFPHIYPFIFLSKRLQQVMYTFQMIEDF